MSSDIQKLAVQYGAAWAALDLDAVVALHTKDTVFQTHDETPSAIAVKATREAFAAILAQSRDLRFERRRVHFGG